MAEIVTVHQQSNIYLKVAADVSILYELKDYFTFAVPGAQFTPQFRAKMWDGKINLFNIFNGQLYVGLLHHLQDFCASREYELVNNIENVNVDDVEVAKKFVNSLSLFSRNQKIEIRDYQLDAILQAVENRRTLLLSPTGSGKSLIIYSLIRWNQSQGRKQLLIVPQKSLVEQMYKDFGDYSSEDADWNVETECAKIYAGFSKDPTHDIVISTWQSLYKLPKEYFSKFDVIYGDECHLFQSKSLTGIMNKCLKADRRIGTTGTLDGTKTHKLMLEGLFGPVFNVTSTKKLMDSNKLATLEIFCIQLDHSDEDKKENRARTYQEEKDFIVSHQKRNVFVRNLALKQKGNTLLLFQYVEKHGKILYDMVQEKSEGGRKIFFIHGGVDVEDREVMREITETEKDAIIVASYGVFSVGVNIKNIHNIIFASPTKSRIRNLQSIGRGLRTSDTKDTCKLFDIGDNLTWKTKKNHTLNHMIERVKIYNEEGFSYKFFTIKLYE